VNKTGRRIDSPCEVQTGAWGESAIKLSAEAYRQRVKRATGSEALWRGNHSLFWTKTPHDFNGEVWIETKVKKGNK
jgi:hypothetical protein